MMEAAHQPDNAQATLWNGPAGQAWVEAQELLDGVFKPFEDLLTGAVAAGSAGRVLDVGCGTGGTTLAVARRLGTDGRTVGIDISEPMIAAARARAERENLPAEFIEADAETHAFPPTRFDTIISRFGVMFFADPVEAFANLRRAARGGGGLRFIAWRGAAENPFMTAGERAAAPLLPEIPARRADGPGQFAFADKSKVQRIVEDSGWTDVEIRPIDVGCAFPERELVGYLTRLGPLGLILRQKDEAARARIVETVRAAFDGYVRGAEVCFTAACWDVEARAPSAGA
jgi:ubiquinone/menaquinone biosynthesis C-methylase UbiE